ncbi:MAG: T9SS type A sorting domain-containing protein [Lewinellaceae bacterium]|nr:T9SS type A sorting domain-containing protein [Lewinellaceae bacterium]
MKRVTLIASVLLLGALSVVNGQNVWPGDVNNNGIVNGVDALYWGLANGSKGSSRTNVTNSWQPQRTAGNWSGVFPDGTSHEYADCNGDGSVDELDLTEIIQGNFDKTHGTPAADKFLVGETDVDPRLIIQGGESGAGLGQLVQLSLALGDALNPVTDFYGVTFTLNFDPQWVKSASINLHPNTWIGNESQVKVFQVLNRATGKLFVTFVRKNKQPTSGSGMIATASVISEDVISTRENLRGESMPPLRFWIEDIQMIDHYGQDWPVVKPQPLEVPILDQQLETKTALWAYPNPANESVVIAMPQGRRESVKRVDVFNAQGQRMDLPYSPAMSGQFTLYMAGATTGWYVVKVWSETEVWTTRIYRL